MGREHCRGDSSMRGGSSVMGMGDGRLTGLAGLYERSSHVTCLLHEWMGLHVSRGLVLFVYVNRRGGEQP